MFVAADNEDLHVALFLLALAIVRYGGVVGGSVGERIGRQMQPEAVFRGALGELLGYFGIVRRVRHGQDVLVVLRGRPNRSLLA